MRRPRIPLRRRVFLGCEGESERGYGVFLARLIEARHRHIHIDAVVLQPGAGDPLALIERAVREIVRREARGGSYAACAALIDSDTRGAAPERDARATVLARRHDLRIIWQDPCHEALLLRHIAGCETLRPADARQAESELLRRWPTYQKGLPAARLAAFLSEDDVLRAARDEPDLRAFLSTIAFAGV